MSLWTFLGSLHPVALFFGGLALVVFAINLVRLLRIAYRFFKDRARRDSDGSQRQVLKVSSCCAHLHTRHAGDSIPYETAEDLARRREALKDYEF